MALILFHLPTLVINQTVTLLYPLYASYKAVTAQTRKTSSVSSYSWSSVHASAPPGSGAAAGAAAASPSATTELAEMEHWLIYWSIFACLALAETTAGWTWRWFPFYYEIRLVFNLWLVLPQTRGATWLYINHLHPFLQGQEDHIDQLIEDLNARLRQQGRGLVERVWSGAFATATNQPAGASGAPGSTAGWPSPHPSTGSTVPPPTQHNPVQAPASQLTSLLGKLAPYAAASAASFLSKADPHADDPHASTRAAALQTQMDIQTRHLSDLLDADGIAPEPQRTLRRAEALARKRELERQLALLNDESTDASTSGAAEDEGSDDPYDRTPSSRSSSSTSPARASASLGAPGVRLRRKLPSGLGESFDVLERSDARVASASEGKRATPSTQPQPQSQDDRWGRWFAKRAS